MVVPTLLRSRSARTGAIVYLVLSIFCTQVPLLNYLGYEFSALTAIVASLLSGFFTVDYVRQGIASSGSSAKRGITVLSHSLIICLTLLVIPLVVMLTNALFVKNCSLTEGLGFFLLLPVPSVVCSVAIGFFCVVFFRHARTAFLLIVLSTFAYALSLGYFTPAIYSYNLFYGFFPGVTYDEAIGLSTSLVLFRVFTLVVAAATAGCALVVCNAARTTDTIGKKALFLGGALVSAPRIYLSAGVGIILVLAFLYRNELGFEAHRTFILKTLDKQWQTGHFTIYYAGGSYSDEDMQWVGAEHEFQLHQILEVLPVSFRGKIESYIYPSNETKQRLIGAGATNIAKPWSGQVHITKQSLDATLKHELVHVLAAPFGVPVIRASLSSGLVEGLAMALERASGNRTLHQYAAALYRFGLAPPLNEMMSFAGFASQSSAVSYILSGSFCRFLIDRYGVRKILLVYGQSAYEDVYGRSLNELIREWQGFLGRVSVTDHDRDAIDVFFRRPPIFRKVCARVLALKMLGARGMYEGKEYSTALTLYRDAFEQGRGYEALSGYLACALRLRRFEILSTSLDTIIMRDPLPGRYLPLFIHIGDALWAEGKNGKADEVYSRLVAADVAEGLTEASTLRIHAVTSQAPAGGLLPYFLSDVSDTLRLRMLDSVIQQAPGAWIPLYLKAKVLERLGRFQDLLAAVRSFTLADTDRRLEGSRLRSEGIALFRLKRFQEAKIPFWSSLNYNGSEAAVEYIKEWVERCDWMSTQPMP